MWDNVDTLFYRLTHPFVATETKVTSSAAHTEVTPEYVRRNWRKVTERVLAGERLRIQGGISIVPTASDEETLRAWGREELRLLLEERRGKTEPISGDCGS